MPSIITFEYLANQHEILMQMLMSLQNYEGLEGNIAKKLDSEGPTPWPSLAEELNENILTIPFLFKVFLDTLLAGKSA